MNLAIDIGNTRIKAALFSGDELKKVSRWNSVDEALKYLRQIKNHHIGICSVTGNHETLLDILTPENEVLILTHETKIPIGNQYKSPETLGMDRLAAVCGANEMFPGKDCLVIDSGTCITYDFLKNESFMGGVISPGLKMRFRSMHQFTKNLPMIEEANDNVVLGRNTLESMKSGGINGLIYEAEGFIKYFMSQSEGLNVILTGGDADVFESKLKTPTFAAPNLVLTGLNSILKYNGGTA
ncbi:MAG: type III pantothenate kinase [Cyclobacteriaceae bacterium]